MFIWSFHIVAISILVAVVGGIAYSMGKQEGLRLASQANEAGDSIAAEQKAS